MSILISIPRLILKNTMVIKKSVNVKRKIFRVRFTFKQVACFYFLPSICLIRISHIPTNRTKITITRCFKYSRDVWVKKKC